MRKFILIFLTTFLFSQELVFYCGITMRKPMREIADLFEKENNIKVKLIIGGSKALLRKMKKLKNGDLYLPGSESYILNNKDLFKEYKYIGYNQLVMVVKKGNPKHITLKKVKKDKDLIIALCNPELSSCGKATKKFLKKDFLDIYFRACEIVLDSRPLNEAVKTYADVGFNWKATIKWEDNHKFLEAVDIGTKKKKLLLAIPKWSKNYELSKKFLDLATSKKGQKIMKKYGFLDE